MLTLAATMALSIGASSASAGAGSKIVEKCAQGQPFGGYNQNAYREALKHLPTEVSEYSDCANLIRKAELAAVGGGGPSPATETSAPNVPLALTAPEQRALQRAHHSAGSKPVQVGSKPIEPGVVQANISSAVNKLPHSLFAVLALMLVGALGLGGREVYQRVNARRNG